MTKFRVASSLSNASRQIGSKLISQTWSPTDDELRIGFKHTERLALQKKLNTKNVSLYGQRVMAHLCVLEPSKRAAMGNVLEVEGFWPQAHTVFKSRNDVISCDVLLTNVDNLSQSKLSTKLPELASDIFNLSLDVKLGTNRAKSFALNHRETLDQDIDSFVGDLEAKQLTWIEEKFETFSGLAEEFVDSPNFHWVNHFFRAYVKQGLVSNIDVYCSSETFLKLRQYMPQNEVLPEISDNDVYLVMQVGNAVVAYSTQAEECFIAELGSKVASVEEVVSQLPKLKYNLGIHLSKTGLWQYRASYMLKNATKFAPKRADYMVK
ncbi:hypothetical protein JCM19241_3068 [Vibrio ishigakensis]|uniref:Uncharacterized protein n=1 Tax=Vibrio ishigakensis TaxID=1481914 RepID=A0A0B8QEK2_9VIBR|nr:hypothetical protein JCM19241_3068 [Vibrio ishigakensis]